MTKRTAKHKAVTRSAQKDWRSTERQFLAVLMSRLVETMSGAEALRLMVEGSEGRERAAFRWASLRLYAAAHDMIVDVNNRIESMGAAK